jgi:hypothetical protein
LRKPALLICFTFGSFADEAGVEDGAAVPFACPNVSLEQQRKITAAHMNEIVR